MESICALCDQQMIHLQETVVLSQNGIKGMNNVSKKCGDDIVSAGQSIHKACCQNYTKPQNSKSGKESDGLW